MSYIHSVSHQSVRGNAEVTAASVTEWAARSGTPCHTDLADSQTPLLNDVGQVNADSTRELIDRLGLLATAFASGLVVRGRPELEADELLVVEAFVSNMNHENHAAVATALKNRVLADYHELRLSKIVLAPKYLAGSDVSPVYVQASNEILSCSERHMITSAGDMSVAWPSLFSISNNALTTREAFSTFGHAEFIEPKRGSGEVSLAEEALETV